MYSTGAVINVFHFFWKKKGTHFFMHHHCLTVVMNCFHSFFIRAFVQNIASAYIWI